MKSIYLKCTLAAAAALVAGAAHAGSAEPVVTVNQFQAVYVRTDGLSTAVARRVEEAAQKGLQPLRQYVQRTKFIHQLDLIDLLMTAEQAQIAQAKNDRIRLVQVAETN